MGTLYIDISGVIKAKNHNTGETAELEFVPRSWSKGSEIKGFSSDSSGRKRYEIRGSWMDKIYLKNLDTGSERLIWKEVETPPNFRKQFSFGKLTMALNYTNADLESVLPVTDSRFRKDIRLWEQGRE